MNKPPVSFIMLIVAGITTAVFGLRDHNAEADTPSAGPLPDIIGLHTGMPLGEAVTLLKAYKSDFQFHLSYEGSMQDNGRGADGVVAERMKDGKPVGESFTLKATWAPPHALYSIVRGGFLAGAVDGAVIMAALRKKYGPECGTTSTGYNSYVSWFFDRQGRSLAGAKECAKTGAWYTPGAYQGLQFTLSYTTAGTGESMVDSVVAAQEASDAARRATERAKEKQQKAQDELRQRTEQNMPKL